MNMKFHRDKAEPLTKILFAVAILLGALMFLKLGFFANSSKAMMTVAQADLSSAGATDLKKLLAETKASADAIKKKNLFVPATAKQFPINEVIGILGHEALIGEKWYKVGDSVGEARIVAIEPTKVKAVWNGQEKEFSPIGAGAAPGGRGERQGLPGQRSGPGDAAKAAGAGSRRGAGQRPPAVSSDDNEQRRNRWMNASPEEKQRLKDEMRQKSKGKSR